MRRRSIPTAIAISLVGVCLSAQKGRPPVRLKPETTPDQRLAILIAEDRRAPAPRDVAVIRAGLRSQDAETSRLAVRALGRLERPDLIPDIVSLLKSSWPEVRAEAANAIGQAAQGSKEGGKDTAAAALIARLNVEEDAIVRAALSQTIGRLPYTTAAQAQAAESALLEALAHDDGVGGRLGVAQGLEALVRLHGKLSPPSANAVARLRELATSNATRDARVRRLALEALTAVSGAPGLDEATIVRASLDPDAQVRRLAIRAASAPGRAPSDAAAGLVKKGLSDPSPIVRLDALRASRGAEGCAAAIDATRDADPHVALLALDQLAPCGASPQAVTALEATVNDLSQAGSTRGWHRGAHAIVALAAAAPDRAKASLPQFVGSRIWQLRMYAARAAALLKDQPTLEKLGADEDDNVAEAAIDSLSRVGGHACDAIYIQALGRRGYQALRAAARALAAPPAAADAGSAAVKVSAALQRLTTEGRDNSRDARVAMIAALQALGQRVPALKPVREMAVTSELNAADLRRLASARARVTIRGVGTVELALFTMQAPATVVRFARLAEAGYYNGLTFHRVVPNFVIQGGSPGANEYVGDATFMRDEVGLWPHVRGAVGISTRGRDTGDAQIFIDLIDNPRLDHEYTVFAQVLNGMDVVDAILEGDVIERVEII